MNEAMLQELLERVRGRFYGKYRGTVTEVDAATMRVKAKVPSVLPTTATGWCMPCVPYAGPERRVGDAAGSRQRRLDRVRGRRSRRCPIWVGCYWHNGEIPSAAPAPA